MSAYLSRDQIVNADDLTYEDVEVAQWGGTVRVRTLTGSERDKFEASFVDTSGGGKKVRAKAGAYDDVRARLVALCVVDEHGNRLFDDADVKRLGRKSAAALDTVATVARRLNGFTSEDIDELAGNSDAAPSGSSISA